MFIALGVTPLVIVSAAEKDSDDLIYTTLRTIDLGTFNEYRYRITEQFFILREDFEVYGTLNDQTLKNIALLADTGYKYLPDNLKNQNYLRELLLAIKKWQQNPNNGMAYTDIIRAIADYLEKVEIQSINGTIEATPISGNAPLTVTLRSNVQDPSGTQIKSGSYTWWVDNGGTQQIIGRGPSMNYTFQEEGNFTVFLDVTSSHKNSEGNTDVLPFRSRVQVVVEEKVASLIIKINGESVWDTQILKFTPDDASYGLIFDATSSLPTSGTRFVETSWDFGNGIVKSYRWSPQIERVRYGREGEYDVKLRLVTNEQRVIEKDFIISIRDPIATIEVNQQDGYIGDTFTFAAKDSWLVRDLTYNWEIIDIDTDRVIFQKTEKVFSYSFVKKWRFNVRLKVRQPSGEVDQDSRIVYITSQAPIANYESSKPFPNKPNKVLLDASKTFDPDFSDDGKLTYTWFIDGNRVQLEESNLNGSVGYYTFDSIGTHSVNLEVIDPDGVMSIKKWEVKIDSILSVEMFAFPRVIQREWFIKFVAESPEAEVFEWNFGDGQKTGGDFDKITHTYDKSGKFNVELKVTDGNNNTNTITQTVYVSESGEPFAHIDVSYGTLEKPQYDDTACGWEGWYIVDRVNTIKFDAAESINIDGENSGLEYSWKIGQSKFSSAQSVSHKFDELGCLPVKLTVKSTNNGTSHSQNINLDVRNLVPTLSALSVDIDDSDADPLVIRVATQGAEDPDGVIQSYLWYYYTSTDSEPQDFRSTATSSTAFVIPKIAETYYFVAILKDNNEARITSEEATGAKYFETISGDNINTPIVELSVNDNSAVIGEELIFTASAHNVLGKTIEKDAEFSWDFDGDGFYDIQTSTPTTTYSYTKSWEFHAKVKVKYRGVSGIKNTTVNISNKLTPDFGHIAIGNKILFFDSSVWGIDARQWDLGDGTRKSGTTFTHVYTDKVPTHRVTLKISEGTKTKEVTKTVKRNIKNMIGLGQWFKLFTYPTANKGKITLDTPAQKVFLYMGESGDEVEYYGVDYDIEYDANFNGSPDDDEDNKDTGSYTTGEILELPLTEYPIQTIRAYTKDAAGNVLGSEDIVIEKTYIEEQLIDPNLIIFENVTASEKEKIESLKDIIETLPQQQRLEAFSYIQKLQENWSDPTEKTRTILDFETYIFSLQLTNEDEVISLLESLLVEWQEDQSAKQIAYQALVNLIPTDIVCETPDGTTCHDNLVSKLTDIKNSDDIEYNKILGKEILGVVATTDTMTNQQKLDFKAILTSLVYGGEVENIPEDEKQSVIDSEWPPTSSDDTSSGWWFLGLLWGILKWVVYIILIFGLIIFGLYILYKIFNKWKDESFTQFITNITTFGKKDESSSSTDNKDDIEDILGTVENNSSPSTKTPEKKQPEDILATTEVHTDPETTNTVSRDIDNTQETQNTSWVENTQDIKKPDMTTDTKDEIQAPVNKDDWDSATKTDDSQVPDWLKWSFQPDDTPTQDTSDDISTDTDDSNDGDTSLMEDTQETKNQDVVADKKQDIPTPSPEDTIPTDAEIDDAIKVDDSEVPDWLKWSFQEDDTSTEKKDDSNDTSIDRDDEQEKQEEQEEEIIDTEYTKEKTTAPVKKTTKKTATIKKPEKKITKKSTTKKTTTKKSAWVTKKEVVKESDTKTSTSDAKKTEKDIKISTPKKKTTSKKKTSSTKKETTIKDDEMKIPDWLSIDDDS